MAVVTGGDDRIITDPFSRPLLAALSPLRFPSFPLPLFLSLSLISQPFTISSHPSPETLPLSFPAPLPLAFELFVQPSVCLAPSAPPADSPLFPIRFLGLISLFLIPYHHRALRVHISSCVRLQRVIITDSRMRFPPAVIMRDALIDPQSRSNPGPGPCTYDPFAHIRVCGTADVCVPAR